MNRVDAEPIARGLEALGLAPEWHVNGAGDPFASLNLPLPTGGTVLLSLLRWDDTVVVRAHGLRGPMGDPEADAFADRLTAAWLMGRLYHTETGERWAAGTGILLLDGVLEPSALDRALSQLGAAVGHWHAVTLDGRPFPPDEVLVSSLRTGLAQVPDVTLEGVAEAAALSGVPLEPRLEGEAFVQRLTIETGVELLVDVALWDGRLLVVRGRLPGEIVWPERQVVLRRLQLVNDRLSLGAAYLGNRDEPQMLVPLPLEDATLTPPLVRGLIAHAVDGTRAIRRRVLPERAR